MEGLQEKTSAISMDQRWSYMVERMSNMGGFKPPRTRPTFRIKEAERMIVSCYSYMLSLKGEEFRYTPDIAKVAAWLTDTQGKGLVLYGPCGQGKTFLARYVIPILLTNCTYGTSQFTPGMCKFYDATYAISHTDEILALTNDVIIIDDVGQEGEFVDFGTRRHTMDEIMDFMEKENKILIMTSNLHHEEEFQERYGSRFADRMNKYMHSILCGVDKKGEKYIERTSLRRAGKEKIQEPATTKKDINKPF